MACGGEVAVCCGGVWCVAFVSCNLFHTEFINGVPGGQVRSQTSNRLLLWQLTGGHRSTGGFTKIDYTCYIS